jgi:CO/xanthine dehydrogenase FAD-binding subunit
VKWFDYAAPATLDEAVRLYAENPKALLLAGGTDLLVQMRAGRKQAGLVIDLKKVPELNELEYDETKGLTLGAAVACHRIYGSAVVRQHVPSLAETAAIIGGTQIQGRASVGGNLCNAAPSADTVPLLIALGAQCRIAKGGIGERTLPVEEFCTAPGKNALGPGELVVSIVIPPAQPRSGAHYLRFIPRNEMDIAVAGVGVQVVLDNGSFRSARIALASVAPTPVFAKAAGDSLAGKPVNEESIAAAGDLARSAASPITDMRGTAEYRRHLCAVLTRRALAAAVRQAKENQ